MIPAPTCGWMRTFWNSSGVNGPGFGKDVLRHGELADVVQKRRGLDAADRRARTCRARARGRRRSTWTRRMWLCAV